MAIIESTLGLNYSKRHILIIDSSLSICIQLSDFLKKLGYENIHTALDGQLGYEVFEDLVEGGNVPVIFLGYDLPDTTATELIDRLLCLRPDVKIIIETSHEKSESEIKEIFSKGTCQYVEKPIRFQKLKEIMETLENEEKIVNDNSKCSFCIVIDYFLRIHTKISLSELSEFCKLQEKDVKSYLDKLEQSKQIKKLKEIQEPACNLCDSVRIKPIFCCPSCNGINFKLEKLLEHYDCGNISSVDSYRDEKCPKCNKKLKILGSDFKILDNFYTCNLCQEKFQDLKFNFLCLKCDNKLKLEQARWKQSPFYKIQLTDTTVSYV